MRHDLQPGAAQHGFGGGPVGNPPVRLVVGVAVLDEVHLRKIGVAENILVPEVVVLVPLAHLLGAANHGLKEQPAAHLLDHFVQGIKRIAQVVEDAHEDHVVELAGKLVDVVHRALLELDLQPQGRGGKAGLIEITVVNVHAEHPSGAALLHLDGIEAAVAADIEHAGARQGPWGIAGAICFHLTLGKSPRKCWGAVQTPCRFML